MDRSIEWHRPFTIRKFASPTKLYSRALTIPPATQANTASEEFVGIFLLASFVVLNGRNFSILLFPCKCALVASFKRKYKGKYSIEF